MCGEYINRGVRTCFPGAAVYLLKFLFLMPRVFKRMFCALYEFWGGRTCFPIAIVYLCTPKLV